MDALSTLLDHVKDKAHGNFLGFLNVLIGRSITRNSDHQVIAKGLTWRELAGCLKKVRWDPEAVRELGLDPSELPPRDRQRFWYSAIAQAKVDSAAARKAGDKFAHALKSLGYEVGAAPK
jgi:hypothetical protein